MENTYWNNRGMFAKEYEQLNILLVPAMGKCATIEGELLRAASKIYYDYYNNGFGNNWSGAFNYLHNYHTVVEIKSELTDIEDYRCGRIPSTVAYNKLIVAALENIVNKVIAYILLKEGQHSTNNIDMLSLGEPDDCDEEECTDYDDYYEDESQYY